MCVTPHSNISPVKTDQRKDGRRRTSVKHSHARCIPARQVAVEARSTVEGWHVNASDRSTHSSATIQTTQRSAPALRSPTRHTHAHDHRKQRWDAFHLARAKSRLKRSMSRVHRMILRWMGSCKCCPIVRTIRRKTMCKSLILACILRARKPGRRLSSGSRLSLGGTCRRVAFHCHTDVPLIPFQVARAGLEPEKPRQDLPLLPPCVELQKMSAKRESTQIVRR